ncbi:MAG: hypothetical protein WB697_14040 [Stellaceae bacterium]
MDHDDDVEHLFSWLQTPELRYREFAGAREITDSVAIVQQQRESNTPVPQDRPVGAPHHDTQLNEEYPVDQFPDQGETRVEMLVESPLTPPEHAGPAARGDVREEAKIGTREEVRGAGRGPLIIPPEPVEGGGLLGGAYREHEADQPGASAAPASPATAPNSQQQGNERSLDAVFGRLSGGRGRLPDPRDRLRHNPGLGPPTNRQR